MTEGRVTSSALAGSARVETPPARLIQRMKASDSSTGVGGCFPLDRIPGEVEHTPP